MTDKMREEFEAWVLSLYPNQSLRRFNPLHGVSEGEYMGFTVQHCWVAWQAARASDYDAAQALIAQLKAEIENLRGGSIQCAGQVSKEGKNQANAWRVIDRKGKRHTVYHEGLAEAIADMGLAVTPMCDVPPSGWECSRVSGHEGPCAASEVSQ